METAEIKNINRCTELGAVPLDTTRSVPVPESGTSASYRSLGYHSTEHLDNPL